MATTRTSSRRPIAPPGCATSPRRSGWPGAVAALGFFFHASYSQISVGSDGNSCSYTDFGALVGASIVVAGLGAGWIVHAGRHVGRRVAAPVLLAFTVVVLVIAGVHVIRGLGIVNNPCDAHPLP